MNKAKATFICIAVVLTVTLGLVITTHSQNPIGVYYTTPTYQTLYSNSSGGNDNYIVFATYSSTNITASGTDAVTVKGKYLVSVPTGAPQATAIANTQATIVAITTVQPINTISAGQVAVQ